MMLAYRSNIINRVDLWSVCKSGEERALVNERGNGTHVVPQSRDPTNSPCFKTGVEFRLKRESEKLKERIVRTRGVWGIDLHL